MATNVRLVMNVPGYNAYRNSPGVVAILEDQADAVAGRFRSSVEAFASAHDVEPPPDGEHVSVTVSNGGTRARAYVRAASIAARLAEAKDRALLQALGGGGA